MKFMNDNCHVSQPTYLHHTVALLRDGVMLGVFVIVDYEEERIINECNAMSCIHIKIIQTSLFNG